jgi:phytanoyl-CoA hydroxylase
MKHLLNREQIAFYQDNGFVVIDDFLAPGELERWRKVVMQAVAEEAEERCPGKTS